MKFTVDRSKWYRGKGCDESKLLREDGKRCCIGFVGRQCGVPDADLLNRRSVRDVKEKPEPIWPDWMRGTEIMEAYATNDSTAITEPEREKRLKEIFEYNGDEIEFVDTVPS